MIAGALAAGGAAVAAGDVVLLAVSWRSRTVLGGLLGAVGIPIVGFALVSAPGGESVAALVIALVFLVVGSALYGLGRAFQRLLDADPRTRPEVSTQCADRRKEIPSDEPKTPDQGGTSCRDTSRYQRLC
jgi:hypothetical protein